MYKWEWVPVHMHKKGKNVDDERHLTTCRSLVFLFFSCLFFHGLCYPPSWFHGSLKGSGQQFLKAFSSAGQSVLVTSMLRANGFFGYYPLESVRFADGVSESRPLTKRMESNRTLECMTLPAKISLVTCSLYTYKVLAWSKVHGLCTPPADGWH